MISLVTKESGPREIPTFLLIVFAASWVLWIAGVLAQVRENLLIFGSAGPALGAAVMLLRGSGKSLLHRSRVGLFLVLIPVSWVVLVLSNAARVGFRSWDWSPILLLPALLPALTVAFFAGAGELHWNGARWPALAVSSMPAFLVLPALVAHFLGLPIVRPGNDQSAALAVAGAAVLFAKQLVFTGFLEEPGWRGWLLPRLQRRFSPLTSAMLVWLPWALWHAPLDFSGSVGRTWVSYVQIRMVYFIAISILLVWFYNHSRGSVLVVALFHAGFNTFPFVLPYSPPFLGLLLVWAAYAVVADRMWRNPRQLQDTNPVENMRRRAEAHPRVQ